MPLNYLRHRPWVSLLRAAAALSVEVRRGHRAFAAACAGRIEGLVDPAGVTAASLVRA